MHRLTKNTRIANNTSHTTKANADEVRFTTRQGTQIDQMSYRSTTRGRLAIDENGQIGLTRGIVRSWPRTLAR